MSAELINYAELVSELWDEKHEITQNSDIIITGSKFSSDKLVGFLQACEITNMPYRIWEYTDHIDFQKDELPKTDEYDFLERSRLFGKGGDLTLRRDGDEFHWYFIGDHDLIGSKDFITTHDYFWERPETKDKEFFLRRQENQFATLWSEECEKDDNGQSVWRDNRVGWAKLHYPISTPLDQSELNKSDTEQMESVDKKLEKQKVYIYYDLFTDAGQVAFVWWKELSYGKR